MRVIIATTLIILLVSLTKGFAYATNANDLLRNDNDNDMLKELLQRMDKMQSHLAKLQGHMDQMDRNHNKRFDKLETNVQNINDNIQNIAASDLNMQDNIKNMSVVMETIVEQQMVITAEIFTVSQTLPFCCCQYQNTTDPPEIKTTTTDSGKPETTTPTTLTSLPTNCDVAMGESGSDGIYQINVTDSNIGPFDVYCTKNVVDNETEKVINGTWMIIQRRQDGTTDFNRNWITYKRGFGDLKGNFWIGLDKLYALTNSTKQELWIQLDNKMGRTAWAKYNHFAISNEDELFALNFLGDYEGNAGNSLMGNVGRKWSTFDNDNTMNCAELSKGAWWFKTCGDSRLNGVYGDINKNGIIWVTFNGYESLKYVHMAIRPKT